VTSHLSTAEKSSKQAIGTQTALQFAISVVECAKSVLEFLDAELAHFIVPGQDSA
jgi:hypothetical protein